MGIGREWTCSGSWRRASSAGRKRRKRKQHHAQDGDPDQALRAAAVWIDCILAQVDGRGVGFVMIRVFGSTTGVIAMDAMEVLIVTSLHQ